MQYCQALKQHLIKQGVRIYEFTHMHKLGKNVAHANHGTITFQHAIVCPGKAEKNIFPDQSRNTFGVQSYIAVSEPLRQEQITAMMPSGECMCRDTDLIYTYYRLT